MGGVMAIESEVYFSFSSGLMRVYDQHLSASLSSSLWNHWFLVVQDENEIGFSFGACRADEEDACEDKERADEVHWVNRSGWR